jgi:hypothetical protein
MDQWAAPSREAVPARLNACGGPHRDRYEPGATEWRSLRTLIGTSEVWKPK